jgi:hypothetical protein
VIILAFIFTLKKHKLASRIFEVAVLVQIAVMFLMLYFALVGSGIIVLINSAIASVLYYFSIVSRNMLKDQS